MMGQLILFGCYSIFMAAAQVLYVQYATYLINQLLNIFNL